MMPPPPMSPKGAPRIGPYQVVRQLGAGSMGIVYLAEDSRLGRQVALKVLPREFASNNERRRRFLREARAASRISHPNVAHVYEVGEHEGVVFLVLELVDGDTLSSMLSEEQMTAARIVQIATEIADALDAAHQEGVIHRDLKPGNIMITRRGRVKLLDFGLAKLRRVSGEEASGPSTLTASGLVVGTVEYMSPEQALGHEIDERSDLFSLGSVLYEMATGVQPFRGANKLRVVSQILNLRPEAISRLNRAIPADLERIILKCLEKDPVRRYQSSRELLADLRNFRRHGSASGRTVAAKKPDGRDRRLPVKIAISVAAIAACIMVWRWLTAGF